MNDLIPTGESQDPIERPRVLILRSYARDRIALRNGLMSQGAPLQSMASSMGLRGLLIQKLFGPVPFIEFLRFHLEEWVGTVESLEPSNPRLAAKDEDWKPHVQALVAQAQCILVLPGTTPGLSWELEYLNRVFPPERILVLLEPAGVLRLPWPSLVKQFAAAGWKLPPDDPGPGTILAFDKNRSASVFARTCRNPWDYAFSVRVALDDLTTDHDAAEGAYTDDSVELLMTRQEMREEWEGRLRHQLLLGGAAGNVLLAALLIILFMRVLNSDGPSGHTSLLAIQWAIFWLLCFGAMGLEIVIGIAGWFVAARWELEARSPRAPPS